MNNQITYILVLIVFWGENATISFDQNFKSMRNCVQLFAFDQWKTPKVLEQWGLLLCEYVFRSDKIRATTIISSEECKITEIALLIILI